MLHNNGHIVGAGTESNLEPITSECLPVDSVDGARPSNSIESPVLNVNIPKPNWMMANKSEPEPTSGQLERATSARSPRRIKRSTTNDTDGTAEPERAGARRERVREVEVSAERQAVLAERRRQREEAARLEELETKRRQDERERKKKDRKEKTASTLMRPEVLEAQRVAVEKRKLLEAQIKKEQEEAMLNAKKRREERESRKRERAQELKIKADMVKKETSMSKTLDLNDGMTFGRNSGNRRRLASTGDLERHRLLQIKREEVEKARHRLLIMEEAAAAARKKMAEKGELNEEEEEESIDEVQQAIANITLNDDKYTQVDFKMEGLDDDTLAAIFTALIDNITVDTVLLDANDAGQACISPLIEMLLKNFTVKILSLSFMQLGDERIDILKDALANNKGIRELSLAGNDLTDVGTLAVASSLKVNNKITTLILADNVIGDQGCQNLLESLLINDTLVYLDLSNNSITAKGAAAIAQVITESDTLRELVLHRNSLQDEGCALISQSLLVNVSLEVLDLSDNMIEIKGIKKLCSCLKMNQFIRQIILRRNVMDVPCEVMLMEVMLTKSIEILYRSPRSKDEVLKDSEIECIISHFTPNKIIEWFAQRRSLEPLADIEKIVQSVNYFDSSVAAFIWEIGFSQSLTTLPQKRILLDMLVIVLKQQIDSKKKLDKALVRIIASDVQTIENIMKPQEVLTFEQIHYFQIYVLLLTVAGDEFVSKQINANPRIIEYATELFFKFPNNNLFHQEFTKFMTVISKNQQPHHLFLFDYLANSEQVKFIDRMIGVYPSESQKLPPQRAGYFGFLTQIANLFGEAAKSDGSPWRPLMTAHLSKWESENEFNQSLKKVNVLESTPMILKKDIAKRKVSVV